MAAAPMCQLAAKLTLGLGFGAGGWPIPSPTGFPQLLASGLELSPEAELHDFAVLAWDWLAASGVSVASYPGGQASGRPPITCTCRWNTV